ncbi:1,4-dihydroxy-2-naphthoate octaprenyltransferase [Fluviicola sp.]|jgi:1,4-dihydroxy-2-naphthoate octaprenyltransferase|uniref:1,4-dihydroxy-2-naphthoate octaprenyltransferase n=1 Tax=Fluviicola sp. TaxID=1917219 RepID=UPI0028341AF5|nr:1,4-dihydroxy-2-naphthoate octaprenyltransferase [Fluviicola sp.]MDR0802501.1 1,4-dihydroxy-2-naphthoate octaprenyltransferase [Fluviicola sp.]
MTNSSDWINALRLRTLPLSVSGILVGSFVAVYQGYWNPIIFLLALFTTLLFQILSNLANDLGDYLKGADNSGRIGPVRAVQSGAISKSAMKNAVVFTAAISFISAGFLIYFGTKHLSSASIYIYTGLAIASILAAVTYTIGKKAYGYNGLGDLFVFIFFGLISVMGVYPLFSDTFSWELVLPAVTIGFLSTSVLNLNNMRDRENDEKVGKRTLAVKLGAKNAKRYHFFLISTAFLSWIFFLVLSKNWLGFVSLIPTILFIKHLIFVAKNSVPKELDSQLKTVALGTFFISILYVISVSVSQWVF